METGGRHTEAETNRDKEELTERQRGRHIRMTGTKRETGGERWAEERGSWER